MNKLIKIFVVLLISFWLWGVDWSLRSTDPDITKYLNTNNIALLIRTFLLIFINLYAILKFKFHISTFIFCFYSLIIALPFVFSNNVDVYKTIIGLLLGSSIFVLISHRNFLFLQNTVYKVLAILFLLGFLFLIIFEFSCLKDFICYQSLFTTIAPDLSGFTTVNYKRFFGFFGGPIIISSIAGNLILFMIFKKKFSSFIQIFLLSILVISILLSNSIAGILFILLYFFITLTFQLTKKSSFKIPKFTKEKMIRISLISLILVAILIFQYKTMMIFFGKIIFLFFTLIGEDVSIGGILNYDQLTRTSGSLVGRIIDIYWTFNDMNLSSYFFGALLDNTREKYISESGLVSIISLYGLPITFLFIYLNIKNFGLKISIILILFNIPYNIFLMHPVYLIVPLLLGNTHKGETEKTKYLSKKT